MKLALAIVLLAASTARADDLEVRLPDEISVAPGEGATVSLTIAPGAGRTISRDGPIRISLASDTLTLPRHRHGRKQAADPDAESPRFELRLIAPTSGDHVLAVDVRVWVCRKKTCRPFHAERTLMVRSVPATPVQPSSP